MTNRQSIVENFIPFFEKYMLPWTGKRQTFETFKEINIRFERKDHHSLEGSKEIARLAYQMNSTKGKERKYTLPQILALMDQSYAIHSYRKAFFLPKGSALKGQKPQEGKN